MKSVYGLRKHTVDKLIEKGIITDRADVMQDGEFEDGDTMFAVHFNTSDEAHRAYMFAFNGIYIPETVEDECYEETMCNETPAVYGRELTGIFTKDGNNIQFEYPAGVIKEAHTLLAGAGCVFDDIVGKKVRVTVNIEEQA